MDIRLIDQLTNALQDVTDIMADMDDETFEAINYWTNKTSDNLFDELSDWQLYLNSLSNREKGIY